mmetsp:Transcript_25475/g.61638  ORF Transcript_25475/g.61638 Transcript_25475/m.61638 type:complete len:231 (+) Transcript_25475:37-729(+)
MTTFTPRPFVPRRTPRSPVRDRPRVDRCSLCSRADLEMAYTIFRRWDPTPAKVITRAAFLEGLKSPPTLESLKVLARSKLEQRFRMSSQPVTLTEFLDLMWPTAKPADREWMQRIIQLTDAKDVLRSRNFRGSRDDLKQLYDILDINGDGKLTPAELHAARILDRADVEKLVQDADSNQDGTVDFKEFMDIFGPAIARDYVSIEMAEMMRAEQTQKDLKDLKDGFAKVKK